MSTTLTVEYDEYDQRINQSYIHSTARKVYKNIALYIINAEREN
jgi:hypothetical protein